MELNIDQETPLYISSAKKQRGFKYKGKNQKTQKGYNDKIKQQQYQTKNNFQSPIQGNNKVEQGQKEQAPQTNKVQDQQISLCDFQTQQRYHVNSSNQAKQHSAVHEQPLKKQKTQQQQQQYNTKQKVQVQDLSFEEVKLEFKNEDLHDDASNGLLQDFDNGFLKDAIARNLQKDKEIQELEQQQVAPDIDAIKKDTSERSDSDVLDPQDEIAEASHHQSQKPNEKSYQLDAKQEIRIGEGGTNFERLGLSQAMQAVLQDNGYKESTAVQEASIPCILDGKDTLIRAQTGSGKTLAYLAPLVDMIQLKTPRIKRSDGTYIIVIVPTRELCLQTQHVLGLLLKRFFWLVGGAIIGGENKNHEKSRLRKGVSILITTPGRVLDHIQNTSAFEYKNINHVVLDEADRLLDMGFEQKILSILDTIKSKRRDSIDKQTKVQIVLLSATLHSRLQPLSQLALENPVVVGFRSQQSFNFLQLFDDNKFQSQDEDFDIPSTLTQYYMTVHQKLRLWNLISILWLQSHLKRYLDKSKRTNKTIVFFSTCDALEFHYAVFTTIYSTIFQQPLLPNHFKLLRLHGNMKQEDRQEAYTQFLQHDNSILLSTDVSARGLDFPDLGLIVQFDPAGEPLEYIHRIGRTARNGETGSSILVLQQSEQSYTNVLESYKLIPQPLNANEMLMKYVNENLEMFKQSKKAQYKEVLSIIYNYHGDFSRRLEEESGIKELAQDAFRSFVRSYSSFSGQMRFIFSFKNLHLGHVAGSFCLSEKPSTIGASRTQDQLKQEKFQEKKSRQVKPKRQNQNQLFRINNQKSMQRFDD